MSRLVWDRTCDYVIKSTEWQFHNEARLDGAGPVVASIGRQKVSPAVPGAADWRIVTYVRGELIDEDFVSDWADPKSFLGKESLCEKKIGG